MTPLVKAEPQGDQQARDKRKQRNRMNPNGNHGTSAPKSRLPGVGDIRLAPSDRSRIALRPTFGARPRPSCGETALAR